uniref:Uncharacterized protein n=1 Tax=Romanomermis culicivorax TaxID=13658 RepID=A0A915JUC4_ROMCU
MTEIDSEHDVSKCSTDKSKSTPVIPSCNILDWTTFVTSDRNLHSRILTMANVVEYSKTGIIVKMVKIRMLKLNVNAGTLTLRLQNQSGVSAKWSNGNAITNIRSWTKMFTQVTVATKLLSCLGQVAYAYA